MKYAHLNTAALVSITSGLICITGGLSVLLYSWYTTKELKKEMQKLRTQVDELAKEDKVYKQMIEKILDRLVMPAAATAPAAASTDTLVFDDFRSLSQLTLLEGCML